MVVAKMSRVEVLTRIAANIRALRRRHNLTQADLAEGAELDLRQIQRAESGTREVGVVTLALIAHALKVSAAHLFRPASLAPTRHGRPPKRRRTVR
jgi:transcriptional regulator with XRE-family HTH domain